MVKYKNSNLNYRLLSALLTTLLTIQPFIQSSYALTSGPSQPEFKSFAPAGREGFVDLFTGDFQYNIPLFELPGPNGGYSFNLGYRSGITMEQEASWVGLGWTLNPGVINRQVRGLPDDFHGGRGDKIITKKNIKPNLTYGLGKNSGTLLTLLT